MAHPPAHPIFPRVFCLTLPGQRERQLNAAQAFQDIGIDHYEFFPGYTTHSPEVTAAYTQGRVKRYPDCFRCHQRDCGNPDCNNILLPVQIAVVLGFQDLCKITAHMDEPYALICEDDILFANYTRTVIESEEFKSLVESSGMLSETPTLIRLTWMGINPQTFFNDEPPEPLALNRNIVMANPCFMMNRAFAQVAYERLQTIDHTVDMIIHDFLAPQTNTFTLNIQLAAELSWSVPKMPSLIHPKQFHVTYLAEHKGADAPETLQETQRVQNHRKKAICRTFCLVGSPRCGSHYASAFLKRNHIDVGHEQIGADGICAWQFAVPSDHYPYIEDRQAQSDFFLHADHWLIYARNPLQAIPSLITENSKAPDSYNFRRNAIRTLLNVDLDQFVRPVEKAARSYIHWYQLALRRPHEGILRVEHFLADCRKTLQNHSFEPVAIPPGESGAGKPYLQAVHKSIPLQENWFTTLSGETQELLITMAATLGYDLNI